MSNYRVGILLLIMLLSSPVISQEMNFSKLKLILAKQATVVEEVDNSVQYKLDGIHIYLITDEVANRMRLMAPVIEKSKLKNKELITLMEANFNRSLDAKYALFNDLLWSVFAHPLKELKDEHIISALYQVKTLAETYGTSYSSVALVNNN